MYKRGLKLWSINTDYYYDEAVRLFNAGIYDYIELYIVPDTLAALPKWKKLCGEAAAEPVSVFYNKPEAPECSINIPFIIHCPHFAHGFNLAKKEKQESNLKIFEQVKRFADELNAQYIVVHGGIDGCIEETARQSALLNDKRTVIENKPFAALPGSMGGEFCRGYNLDEIKLVMKAADCGFCLDFGHAVCAANSLHIEPYKYIEDFLTLNPSMYHLTDINDMTSTYDAHPHLGKGQLDIKRILKMIPDNKHITFETNKNSKENLNDFIEDMEWLKNFR